MNQENNKKISFLLADDHSLIRQGIFFMLEDIDLEKEIFQASNLQQTLEIIKSKTIDIAVIDAHFPDGNSLSIIPEIKKISPDTKILIFTGIDESTQSLKYLNAGANGFLSKMSEEKEIENALKRMCEDGEYISAVTKALLLDSLQDRRLINPLFRLTERELQVAEMYAEGLGNLEIANQLDVKQNTVSTLKRRIFEKLKIDNIVELIDLVKTHN